MIVDRRAPIYPIRTVAHLSGVNPRRIRAWEDQYNLLTPARTGGGHRLYSEEDVERIRWVKAMVDRGMSLKGIQRLMEMPPPEAGEEGFGAEAAKPASPRADVAQGVEMATEGRGAKR